MILIIVAAFISSYILYLYYYNSKLPPGPWGLPIIGYIHQMTNDPLHIFMNKMAVTHGKMFSIKLGERLVIVISDKQTVKELFSKNGKSTSSRPNLSTFEITRSGATGISLCDYSLTYKRNRKLLVQTFNQYLSKTKSFHGVLQVEADKLVTCLNNRSNSINLINISEIFHIAIPSIMIHAMFGLDISYDNEHLRYFVDSNRKWFECAETNNMADYFSILSYFPMKKLEEIRKCSSEYASCLQEYISQSKNNPKGMFKILNRLISENTQIQSANLKKEQELKRIISDTVGGGFDTISASLSWVIYYLCKNKQIYLKCQNELRSTTDKSLTSNGEIVLPYFKATIYETLRYSSVVPLGLPHSTTKKLDIHGYHLPKGSMVFANLYSINHDATLWKDPNNFNPDNFLNTDGTFNSEARRNLASFSYGIRSCPGEHFAMQQMSAILSTIILNFDFELESPMEEIKFSGGLTTPPKPYMIKVIPIKT